MASFFNSIQEGIGNLVHGAEDAIGVGAGADEKHSHTHVGEACGHLHTNSPQEEGAEAVQYRYHSFAPQSEGDVKWFVDGCGYFWAVSVALEEAQEEIWILDCKYDKWN